MQIVLISPCLGYLMKQTSLIVLSKYFVGFQTFISLSNELKLETASSDLKLFVEDWRSVSEVRVLGSST